MKRIFLSYAHQDIAAQPALVQKLKDLVRGHEQVSFIDSATSISSGGDLRAKTVAALKSSDEVCVLWTSASSMSSWVNYETGLATALGKPITVVVSGGAPAVPQVLKQFKVLKLA